LPSNYNHFNSAFLPQFSGGRDLKTFDELNRINQSQDLEYFNQLEESNDFTDEIIVGKQALLRYPKPRDSQISLGVESDIDRS
jgi:hypothetical protein